MVVLLLLYRLIIFAPPPPKKKPKNKLAKLLFCLLKQSWNQCKTDCYLVKFAEKISTNLAFFSDSFLARFVPNFSAKFPQNRPVFPQICLWRSQEIWMFSAAFQRPCVMKGYKGHLFLSPPTFFPSRTSIMSSLDQLYLKKVNVWITL